MADNVAITAGAGTTVGTDERTINAVAVQVQRVDEQGATTFAATQATCDTGADQLVAARDTRKKTTFLNVSAIVAYLGASGVTTSTGFRLDPGASVTFSTQAAVYGITASGTATICCWEEYDS